MRKYSKEDVDYINNSINVVDYAMQYLDLKQLSDGEYWVECPFHRGDTTPSLSFNRKKNVFHCFSCGIGGSTIQFVQNYHNLSFLRAISYIIEYNNLEIEYREHSDVLDFLHKANFQNKKNKPIEREYLPDSIIEKYIKEPITEWLNEGIKQEVLDKYEVRYDKKNNKIVFPIRDINGKIIAIKGRTLYRDHAELGIRKYVYYQKIITNNFLFGLYQNLPYIKEKNEVIVLEGAKGVMLAESYGYKNVVSLETNNINKYQEHLLLQLKANIVFALDKGIKIITNKKNTIKNSKYTYVNIGLLSKLTNVYAIEDKEDLLKDKDCPCDYGKSVWDTLYMKHKHKL